MTKNNNCDIQGIGKYIAENAEKDDIDIVIRHIKGFLAKMEDIQLKKKQERLVEMKKRMGKYKIEDVK